MERRLQSEAIRWSIGGGVSKYDANCPQIYNCFTLFVEDDYIESEETWQLTRE